MKDNSQIVVAVYIGVVVIATILGVVITEVAKEKTEQYRIQYNCPK